MCSPRIHMRYHLTAQTVMSYVGLCSCSLHSEACSPSTHYDTGQVHVKCLMIFVAYYWCLVSTNHAINILRVVSGPGFAYNLIRLNKATFVWLSIYYIYL